MRDSCWPEYQHGCDSAAGNHIIQNNNWNWDFDFIELFNKQEVSAE